MHPETDYLKTIAEEIAANYNNTHLHPHLTKANHHLEMEAKRVEKAIIQSLHSIENFTQRDTFHFNTLNKLVQVCDILFDASHKVTPDVMILLELLASVKQILPNEIRPNLKLAKAFIVLQEPVMSASWAVHEAEMHKQGIKQDLIDIAAIPFKRFSPSRHKLYWGDFTWLKGYLAKLEIMDWAHADCNSPEEALLSLLIGREFNDDRFYVYCKKYVINRSKAAANKRSRLQTLAACEKLVLQDTQVGVAAFDIHANAISARLIKWIKEEIDFVETHERDVPLKKFEFKWNVQTIAFFFKLLLDHKVFGKVGLESFSEQIAANCSSVGKEEFQPATIFSRFYVKDLEVVKAVDSLLNAMLDDVRQYLR